MLPLSKKKTPTAQLVRAAGSTKLQVEVLHVVSAGVLEHCACVLARLVHRGSVENKVPLVLEFCLSYVLTWYIFSYILSFFSIDTNLFFGYFAFFTYIKSLLK